MRLLLRALGVIPFVFAYPLVVPYGLSCHGGGPHSKIEWLIHYLLFVPFCIGWPLMLLAAKMQGE